MAKVYGRGGARWILISFVLAVCLVWMGSAGIHEAQAQKQILVWGMPSDTDILDPHATGGWVTYHVTYQIFEGLAKENLKDPNATYPEVIPGLATRWDISDDGLEYTFYLREGVKFHDGTPWNAEAAKYNFDRFWNKESPHFYPRAASYCTAYVKWIKNVEIIDPMTIKVTLTGPNYEWILSGLQSWGQPLMISPTALKKYGDEGIPLHPVGTGPFKLAEREPGVKIVLDRNDDYWGEKAKLDRIIFRPMEEVATRVNAMKTGEVHVIQGPPWDAIEGLLEDGFTLTTNRNVPFVNFLYLNFKNPHLQDKRVRQAINMALDREGMSKEIFYGTGYPAYGMLSPGTYAFDPDFKMYEYNPEKAKQLLAEAGYADGFEMDFDIFAYGTAEMVENWIARDLKKIGITCHIKKYEWITYMQRWIKGMEEQVGMAPIGWGMTTPSWTGIVSRCDTRPPNGMNSGWYCNEEVDRLLDLAIAEKDLNKAREYYQEANRVIMEDAAFAPTYNDMQPVILSPKVKGFVNPPEDWFDLSTVWMEE